MPHARNLGLILGALLAVSVMAAGTQPVSADPNSGGLGYGFGAQLDQPFQAVGSQAAATVFFFNLSGQDAFGFADPVGGEGCSFFVNILDTQGRLVRRPQTACPLVGRMPIGPFPLPAGTFRRFDVPLPLTYASSETGDPDGALLPGGLYTLQATQPFGGPGPGGSPLDVLPFPGGDPEARIPFRIFQCSPPAGPLPFREMAQGAFSGYRSNDPNFFGEDLVLRTGGAGLQYWRQHTSFAGQHPDPPAVDLTHEMVLVSLLGPRRSSGASSIHITAVEEKPCHLEVTVVEVIVPFAPAVLTNAFFIVAVPRSLKEVVFVHRFLLPAAAQ